MIRLYKYINNFLSMIKNIIFDLVDTLYDQSKDGLYQDALPALNDLKKRFGLILVTDKTDNKESLVHDLGLKEIFDKVIIESKNKELFNRLLNESRLHHSECIVVGDGATNELNIANELNIKSIKIKRNSKSKSKKNTRYISSLTEIMDLIDSINKNNQNNIIDQKEITLKDRNNKKYNVSVYLKEVLVRNNNYNTKAFCKITKSK